MALNIHPFVVHMPIGLLSLYTFLEVVSIKKFQTLPYWFFVKAILVIFGSFGAYASLFTGSLVVVEFDFRLLEAHARFAVLSTIVYTILGVIYLLTWLKYKISSILENTRFKKVWYRVDNVRGFLMRRFVLFSLSIIGFIFISITGALGGALVYGPDIDPFVKIIYDFFVK